MTKVHLVVNSCPASLINRVFCPGHWIISISNLVVLYLPAMDLSSNPNLLHVQVILVHFSLRTVTPLLTSKFLWSLLWSPQSDHSLNISTCY